MTTPTQLSAPSPTDIKQMRLLRLDSLIQEAVQANDEEAAFHLSNLKTYVNEDADLNAVRSSLGEITLDYHDAVHTLMDRREGKSKKELQDPFDRAISGKLNFKESADSLNSMFKDIVAKGSGSKHYSPPLERYLPTASAFAFGEDMVDALADYKRLSSRGEAFKLSYSQKRDLANRMAHQARADKQGFWGKVGDIAGSSVGHMSEMVSTGSPLSLASVPASGGLRGAIQGANEPFTHVTPVLDEQGNLRDIETDLDLSQEGINSHVMTKARQGAISGAIESLGGKVISQGIKGLGGLIPKNRVGEFLAAAASKTAQKYPGLAKGLSQASTKAGVNGFAGEVLEEDLEAASQWIGDSLANGEITEREAGIGENLIRGVAGDEKALKDGMAGLIAIGAIGGSVDVALRTPGALQIATDKLLGESTQKSRSPLGNRQSTEDEIDAALRELPAEQLRQVAKARSRKEMLNAIGGGHSGNRQRRKSLSDKAQAELDRRSRDSASGTTGIEGVALSGDDEQPVGTAGQTASDRAANGTQPEDDPTGFKKFFEDVGGGLRDSYARDAAKSLAERGTSFIGNPDAIPLTEQVIDRAHQAGFPANEDMVKKVLLIGQELGGIDSPAKAAETIQRFVTENMPDDFLTREDESQSEDSHGVVEPSSEPPEPSQSLYRETDLDGLSAMLGDTHNRSPFGKSELFFTDSQDLAIGQGDNQGVAVELDGAGLKVREHKKPGTGMEGVGKEFVYSGHADELADRVKSVVIDPTKVTNRAMQRRMANWFSNNGWTPEALTDGRTRYVRPDQHAANPTQPRDFNFTEADFSLPSQPARQPEPAPSGPSLNAEGWAERYAPEHHTDTVEGITIQPLSNAFLGVQLQLKSQGIPVKHLSPEQMDSLSSGALGVFKPDPNDPQGNSGVIVINRDTPNPHIYRVIVHEYGHALDYGSERGQLRAKKIISRLVDVNDAGTKAFLESLPGNTELREEIAGIQARYSRYSEEVTEKYQKSAAEQAADVIATLILDPAFLAKSAPNAYAIVKEKLRTDEKFAGAYKELADYVTSGRVLDDALEQAIEFNNAGITVADELHKNIEKRSFKKRVTSAMTKPIYAWLADARNIGRLQSYEAQEKEANTKSPWWYTKDGIWRTITKTKGQAHQSEYFSEMGRLDRIGEGSVLGQVDAARAVTRAEDAGVPYKTIGTLWYLLGQSEAGTRAGIANKASEGVRTDAQAARDLADTLEKRIASQHGPEALELVRDAIAKTYDFQQYVLRHSYELGGISEELYESSKGRYYSSQEDLSRKLFEGNHLYNVTAAATGSVDGTVTGDVLADSLAKPMVLLNAAMRDHELRLNIQEMAKIDKFNNYARKWSRAEVEEQLRELGKAYEELGIDLEARELDDNAKMTRISDMLGLDGQLMKVRNAQEYELWEVPLWFAEQKETERIGLRARMLKGIQLLGKLNTNKWFAQTLLTMSPTFGTSEFLRTSITSTHKLALDFGPSTAVTFAKEYSKALADVTLGKRSLAELVEYNQAVGLRQDAYRDQVVDVSAKGAGHSEIEGRTVKSLARRVTSVTDTIDPRSINLVGMITGRITGAMSFTAALGVKPYHALRTAFSSNESREQKRAEWEASSQKLDEGIDAANRFLYTFETASKYAAVKSLETAGYSTDQAVTYVNSEIGNPVFDQSEASIFFGLLNTFARAKTAGLVNLYADARHYPARFLAKGSLLFLFSETAARTMGLSWSMLLGFLYEDDEEERAAILKELEGIEENEPSWMSNGAVSIKLYGGKDEEGNRNWMVYRVPVTHEYASFFVALDRVQRMYRQEKPEDMPTNEWAMHHLTEGTTDALKAQGLTSVGPFHEAVTGPIFADQDVLSPLKSPFNEVGPYDAWRGERVTGAEEIREFYAKKLFGPIATIANEVHREISGEEKRGFVRKPKLSTQLLVPNLYELDQAEMSEADYFIQRWRKEGRSTEKYFESLGLQSQHDRTKRWHSTTPSRTQDAIKRAYYNVYLLPLEDIREAAVDYDIAPIDPRITSLQVEKIQQAKEAAKSLGVNSSVKASASGELIKASLAYEYRNALKALRRAERSNKPNDISKYASRLEVYSEALEATGESAEAHSPSSRLWQLAELYERRRATLRQEAQRAVQRVYTEAGPNAVSSTAQHRRSFLKSPQK